MDASVRQAGAMFNQPQYASLKEQLTALQGQLEQLTVRHRGGAPTRLLPLLVPLLLPADAATRARGKAKAR
jgi:hypothetical protein